MNWPCLLAVEAATLGASPYICRHLQWAILLL